jgi:hypothetical protein
MRASETNEHQDALDARWGFGLEEIPASDKDEDGAVHRIASAFHTTLIRAP